MLSIWENLKDSLLENLDTDGRMILKYCDWTAEWRNMETMGPDTKTIWPTDRRSQCNFDFDLVKYKRLKRGGFHV
jgi:hypothetical protein